MSTTQTSVFPSAPIAGARTSFPEIGLDIDYFITEDNEVCVMHNRPFSKELSWLEYHIATSRLEIIMEDGEVRDYGLPVHPKLKPYFQNTHVALVILLNLEEGRTESGVELPLIVHAA